MGTNTVTIKFGLTKQVTRDVEPGATIRQVISNPAVRSILGHPENVSAVIDGQTVSLDDTVQDGDVIQLEKQAASKAA